MIIYFWLDKQVTRALDFSEPDWHKRTYGQIDRDGYDEEDIYEFMGKELNKMEEQGDSDELFQANQVPWWLDNIYNWSYLLCWIMLVVSVVMRHDFLQ